MLQHVPSLAVNIPKTIVSKNNDGDIFHTTSRTTMGSCLKTFTIQYMDVPKALPVVVCENLFYFPFSSFWKHINLINVVPWNSQIRTLWKVFWNYVRRVHVVFLHLAQILYWITFVKFLVRFFYWICGYWVGSGTFLPPFHRNWYPRYSPT